MKKTVVKVCVDTEKSKREVLKAVAKLEGIDQLSIDGDKGTVTVIGDVDPVLVYKQLKKVKKSPNIVSVGPPKAAEKENTPNPSPSVYYPPSYPTYLPPYCELIPIGSTFDRW
ncbi:heavy metal-associated isoprenylated plant protein 2-like isoform X1 [Punica granatum]|uniref:HMA domain-containing protein n=2 Tax=Punica granatum TaxID=22663 RepID=A0A218XNM6_PUNGR|nr:heavy metal-associated isoprenylated plant protein 2-like isoform X1 [Punica granatum]OWM86101.1 hypothetical protein CDL15_Pgr010925 [Punica granatum]PKI53424.1 hypothetical protein CRG98_026213 [Punica granatum]